MLPHFKYLLICRSFQIQRQQALEDFFVRHLKCVVGPAIGISYCCVQSYVGRVQPGGALVLELGEGAFGQIFFVAGFSDDAVWVGATGHA